MTGTAIATSIVGMIGIGIDTTGAGTSTIDTTEKAIAGDLPIALDTLITP
jgi:hypothetical protein